MDQQYLPDELADRSYYVARAGREKQLTESLERVKRATMGASGADEEPSAPG